MNLPPPVTGHNQHEPIDLDLPPSPPMPMGKGHKVLGIVFIASALILLAAICSAAWLFSQKSGEDTIITKLDPNSTNNVTNLSWIAPAMPAGYAKYDQSTNDAQIFYYANTGEGCSVTTRVMATPDTKDMAQTAATLNDSQGITTKTLAGEGEVNVTLKDADGQREYDFKGAEFDQDVNVPTVDFKSQSGVVYYRQFGNNLATLSFVCKQATFQVNAEGLTTLLKQFTIKTER